MTDSNSGTVGGDREKPEDVTISEGLAKIHEASEQLTEEQEDAMADKAREAAKESQAEHDKRR